MLKLTIEIEIAPEGEATPARFEQKPPAVADAAPEQPAASPHIVTWEDRVPSDWEANGIGVSY